MSADEIAALQSKEPIELASPSRAPADDATDDAHLAAGFYESLHNGKIISWRYWVHQLPTLTAAQAARLMCGLEPDVFENLDSRPNKDDDPSELCEKAKKIQRLAESEGKLNATPCDWLKWARAHKFNMCDLFRIEAEGREKADAERKVKEDAERAVREALKREWREDDEFRTKLEQWRQAREAASESNTEDKKQLPAGVTSSDIVDKFKLTDAWADKLRHINRYNYLRPALMRRGSRKSGNKAGAAHLWNPVKFAEILIERDDRLRSAMARIIENRFPEWQDEWDAAQAVDEPDE